MSFSSLPEDFSKKCLIIGVLQEKIDYKLSDFQRTTNLTQHIFARLKVELIGIEPTTSCLQSRRSPS